MAIAQLQAYDEFIEFITSSPTLQQIVEFRLSDDVEARISLLLDANRSRKLTAEEEGELDEYLRLSISCVRLRFELLKNLIKSQVS